MVDHARREEITLLFVNDALEANDRDLAEATAHLLDAVGTLIVHAELQNGADAKTTAELCGQYLVDQIARNLGGAQ